MADRSLFLSTTPDINEFCYFQAVFLEGLCVTAAEKAAILQNPHLEPELGEFLTLAFSISAEGFQRDEVLANLDTFETRTDITELVCFLATTRGGLSDFVFFEEDLGGTITYSVDLSLFISNPNLLPLAAGFLVKCEGLDFPSALMRFARLSTREDITSFCSDLCSHPRFDISCSIPAISAAIKQNPHVDPRFLLRSIPIDLVSREDARLVSNIFANLDSIPSDELEPFCGFAFSAVCPMYSRADASVLLAFSRQLFRFRQAFLAKPFYAEEEGICVAFSDDKSAEIITGVAEAPAICHRASNITNALFLLQQFNEDCLRLILRLLREAPEVPGGIKCIALDLLQNLSEVGSSIESFCANPTSYAMSTQALKFHGGEIVPYCERLQDSMVQMLQLAFAVWGCSRRVRDCFWCWPFESTAATFLPGFETALNRHAASRVEDVTDVEPDLQASAANFGVSKL